MSAKTAAKVFDVTQRWLSQQAGGKPFWHREPVFHPWQADDDQLQFELVGERPWPGWNMIELDVNGDEMYGVATITVEARHKRFQLGIPLRPGKTAKRLVFMPFGVKRILITTVNAMGAFQVQRLRWVWLTPWFAHDRLARRLSSIHPNYKGMSRRQVWRALHQESVARACSWKSIALAEHTQTFMRSCAHYNYSDWVVNVEPEIDRLPAHWQPDDLIASPTFAVLLPLHEEEFQRVGMDGLKQTLESLRAQNYPQWALSVSVSSELPEKLAHAIRLMIHQTCEKASRVSVCRESSLTALSHHAFIHSTGEGILSLAPGDVLAPEALARVVDGWLDEPDCQLFYADEDVLGSDGQRAKPRFKPQWNPDLLLSSGYIGRMTVYKRRMLWRLEVYQGIGRRIRGELTRPDIDHAQALRFLSWQYQREESASVAVKHLPWMLYHRHIAHHDADQQRQDYTGSLVEDWVQFTLPGCDASVTHGQLPFSAHVHWPINEKPPLVSLLVPTRDGVDILKPCVDRILELTEYRHFELLILDNQSTCPRTLTYLAEVEGRDPRVRVLRWNHPFNYSAINNFGVRHAKGEIIGLVNNDIEPIDGSWLAEMVRQVLRPEIGCVGAKLYYPNGTLQHGGVILGLGGVAGHAHRFFPRQSDGYCGRLKLAQNLTAVTAACLLLRKNVFNEVNGLNEPRLAVAYNDVDLCLKVHQAGYRNLWTPYAELYHHESISRGADDTPKKRARWLKEMAYMRRTWAHLLDNDPAYNPNLTLVYEDFSLR
ncbi:glycosyltransferase family 2 protein [Halomonas sp. LS-001]